MVVKKALSVYGGEIRVSWDTACYLHVCGFHERILDKESVLARIESIKRLVEIAGKILGSKH